MKRRDFIKAAVGTAAVWPALARAQNFPSRAITLIVPDFGTIEGLFQISSLEFSGEHNGEVTFDLSLESAGALTFAAA